MPVKDLSDDFPYLWPCQKNWDGFFYSKANVGISVGSNRSVLAFVWLLTLNHQQPSDMNVWSENIQELCHSIEQQTLSHLEESQLPKQLSKLLTIRRKVRQMPSSLRLTKCSMEALVLKTDYGRWGGAMQCEAREHPVNSFRVSHPMPGCCVCTVVLLRCPSGSRAVAVACAWVVEKPWGA